MVILFVTQMEKKEVYDVIKSAYPVFYKDNNLANNLQLLLKQINYKVANKDVARIGNVNKERFNELIKKYSIIPKICLNPQKKTEELVQDLFEGVPRWRSPLLQFNVGAPTSIFATAMYSLSLEENVYTINDGLAGNTLVAESSVSNILGDLAKVKTKVKGLFTFGGAATNLYAVKVGIKKSFQDSSKLGIPNNMKLFMTEDGHFAHMYAAEWLGIGGDNVIVMNAKKTRDTCLIDAEIKLRDCFENGDLIACIIINGGTSYGHIVDDIKGFVDLRDKLVKEYDLKYTPHIHVDSVIGWMWLFFQGYDFEKNELNIDNKALELIRIQFNKIKEINLADSWGVDFHKGIGSCPVDSSIFILNDEKDAISYLSKINDSLAPLHQVAEEFSFESPVNYTLENSRPAGPFLAALTALQTIGIDGFRRNLANLIEMAVYMRSKLKDRKDIYIFEDFSSGFVNMTRIYPLEILDKISKSEDISLDDLTLFKYVNKYNEEFFKWDFNDRIAKNVGLEFSYSTNFFMIKGVGVHCLKFYPVSPHFNFINVEEIVKTLIERKEYFDNNLWKNSENYSEFYNLKNNC